MKEFRPGSLQNLQDTPLKNELQVPRTYETMH